MEIYLVQCLSHQTVYGYTAMAKKKNQVAKKEK